MRGRGWTSWPGLGLGALGLFSMVLSGCYRTQMSVKVGQREGLLVDWKLPEQGLRTDRKVCIELTGKQDCYVYVLAKGGGGIYNVLVPNPTLGQTDNHIQAGKTLELPIPIPGAEAALDRGFVLDWSGGPAEMILVCTRNRVPELDRLHLMADRSPAAVDKILAGIDTGSGLDRLGVTANAKDKTTTVTVTSLVKYRSIAYRMKIQPIRKSAKAK